ncbi:hypothetical protein N7517_005495 [Penicillium concentricum]|uniref:Xylanolytic transcriptional activator regulatory domain-containing protein n=1 Tax=Penicillium concentricum TaxID=293559 RepID=A0A9W9SAA8_9EURO|nr:uncharacterized protein N7517_005495 [Penicillium concentricum]KAJ5373489.1 hypothetical protein N7517_005495 [Penicillium concentricum]
MTSGPVILITAGSAGLGAVVARTFARQGYRVAINYISNSERAESVVAQLSDQEAGQSAGDQESAKYIAIRADLGSRADIHRLVKETHDAMGRIDIVFSNGGWSRFRDTTSIDDNAFEEDWDQAFNINVKSHLWVLHAAKAYLEEAEGSFITTSSIAGAYGVTKAAQLHMVKALAGMVGPSIRVNSVSPGLLQTNWARRFTDEQKETHRQQTKLKRFVELEDVAAQVLLLARPSCSFIAINLFRNAQRRSSCYFENLEFKFSKGASFVLALSQEEEEMRQIIAIMQKLCLGAGEMYVQGLEERLRRLGRAVSAKERDTPQDTEATSVLDNNHLYDDSEMQEPAMVDPQCSPKGLFGGNVETAPTITDNAEGLIQGPAVNPWPAPNQTSTFGQQLTALSLEATAERHLGSTTGLSFANLTQKILRRLTPDKADFVFNSQQETNTGIELLDLSSPSDPFNDSFFQSLSESISTHPLLFGDLFFAELDGSGAALDPLAWPSDETHVRQLVDFYFAHSHTLYPILKRSEVMDTLESICQDPRNLATQAPINVFRIWMVLAIGSTAYSSVTLTEESESMLFYNNALQYSEQALGSDEMSALEAIMLQVSFSFFNQLGPNTWFLVGTAARLALGMGLHAASSYRKFPLDVQQRRKRIFFSIYMMDRVVSITLGRPFALHDDDIDVTPFENADEELIHADCIIPQTSLQPSMMAVPLHILSLRKIAGKISRKVYRNVKDANLTLEEREAIIASLHQELLDWRRSMPFPLPDVNDNVPHLNTTWYDFNYYTHLAMIYRPSPLFPVSDLKRIKMLETAASMSLRHAFSMHQQQRFAYNWLNFLALFTATLSLIYAITAQPDDLSAVLRNTRAIADLDLATQLFEILGLKFLEAKKIQGMIAEISRRYKEVLAAKDMGPI